MLGSPAVHLTFFFVLVFYLQGNVASIAALNDGKTARLMGYCPFAFR
jgi:hypothetical protein